MLISKITKTESKKYKIFGDNEYLFFLYGNELRKYNIHEGSDISDALIEDINNNVIYKRGKERALFLLERQPYSVFNMRHKLISAGYNEGITDTIIDFLIRYNYLNDASYVSMYIESNQGKKNKRQITYNLISKGIDRRIIDDYFDNNAYSDDDCFIRQYNKYIKGKDLGDPITRQKIFRYFYSKGFSVSLINQTMNNYE